MLQPRVPILVDGLHLNLISQRHVVLAGRLEATGRERGVVDRLDELHRHAVKEMLPQFQVDVSGLEFVNSSAIRLFVDWIAKAERAGYRLVFVVDHSVTWQRLSFSVLRSLSPRSVEIQDGRAPENAGW